MIESKPSRGSTLGAQSPGRQREEQKTLFGRCRRRTARKRYIEKNGTSKTALVLCPEVRHTPSQNLNQYTWMLHSHSPASCAITEQELSKNARSTSNVEGEGFVLKPPLPIGFTYHNVGGFMEYEMQIISCSFRQKGHTCPPDMRHGGSFACQTSTLTGVNAARKRPPQSSHSGAGITTALLER